MQHSDQATRRGRLQCARVSVTYKAEPGGFLKLTVPLFVIMGKRQLQSALDNLKGLMEAKAL